MTGRRHALIFNAISHGLSDRGRFAALSDREHVARLVGEALDADRELAAEARAAAVEAGKCCDLHGTSCEPPSELCCNACAEAAHPQHPADARCVLDAEQADAERAEELQRCPSCDHAAARHRREGCRHTVTVGTPYRAPVCPCSVPRAALEQRDAVARAAESDWERHGEEIAEYERVVAELTAKLDEQQARSDSAYAAFVAMGQANGGIHRADVLTHVSRIMGSLRGTETPSRVVYNRLHQQMRGAEEERDAALATVEILHTGAEAARDQLLYDRRLLGEARAVLDRVATGGLRDWVRAPDKAGALVERITEELGRPATDADRDAGQGDDLPDPVIPERTQPPEPDDDGEDDGNTIHHRPAALDA